jgi:hypothetical protein
MPSTGQRRADRVQLTSASQERTPVAMTSIIAGATSRSGAPRAETPLSRTPSTLVGFGLAAGPPFLAVSLLQALLRPGFNLCRLLGPDRGVLRIRSSLQPNRRPLLGDDVTGWRGPVRPGAGAVGRSRRTGDPLLGVSIGWLAVSADILHAVRSLGRTTADSTVSIHMQKQPNQGQGGFNVNH